MFHKNDTVILNIRDYPRTPLKLAGDWFHAETQSALEVILDEVGIFRVIGAVFTILQLDNAICRPCTQQATSARELLHESACP